MSDRIVYVVVTKPGGVDGMDRTAKGGPKYASFDKEDAREHVDAWSELKIEVIEDYEKKTEDLVKRLNPIERLMLEERFM